MIKKSTPSPIIKTNKTTTSPLRQQQLNQLNPSTPPTTTKTATATATTTPIKNKNKNINTSPINKLNSQNSTPRSAENHDRRSFQGDHHRHRYMTYSATTTPSPNSIQSNQQTNHHHHHHQQQQQQQQHLTLLGAPPNAHYSPHYGQPAQRAPTSKRKPAPPLSPSYPPSSPILDSLTPRTPSPSHSNSSYLHSPEISPSRRTHRKLIKSRSPSPSPRSGTAIVKKIGSALVAPFRNSNSRRGSDASEIGLSIQEVSRLSSFGPPVQPSGPAASSAEHLPWMPSVGAAGSPTPGAQEEDPEGLTEAERIVRASRSRGTLADGTAGVFPERVLRVVNGSASVSTRASGESRTSELGLEEAESCKTTQPLNIVPSQNSRHSYLSTSTKAGCTKCVALEEQLRAEVARGRALERALDAQTLKLDQLRNWATAKVSSLDQTLQAQEKLLQQVEQRMAERHQPDIKSDYLIALQKDYVELNARLALLEAKEHEHDEDEDDPHDSSPLSPPSHSGRSTLPAYVSKLLEDPREVRPLHTRAYSTPPLATGKARPAPSTSPFSRPSWKPASPATLASKLVPPPPSTPRSPNARSAPVTPSSASCRPRYTSALGVKAPSPLGFSYETRKIIDQEDEDEETGRSTRSARPPTLFDSASVSRPVPGSPSAASSWLPNHNPRSPRISGTSTSNGAKHSYARPTLASSSRLSALNPSSSSSTFVANNRKSSNANPGSGLSRSALLGPPVRNSPAQRLPRAATAPPINKNKAVGELIRLFDQPK
ncbi:hypothetical protein PGT21_025614 [Puccinia graminis f. sp. tritici]|uniref:Uncharacterized protein n=1 Tax=Puccinia graminis f. sp. tritici TaxID=56615 RepID=A0A5B0MLT5_PUCGR|nr:hypothetical protein PGT21_025614 [Puccinia graminis f. sp. tritici]KAA1118564.1 hypothetical protein PGTUg99_008203 [Puccinia graminis f. sp. tritici]